MSVAPYKTFKIDTAVKERLVKKLRAGSDIFSFEDDPAVASLCTCLGLEFEMGNRAFDRLSPFLGVDLEAGNEASPWAIHFLLKDERIGICLERRDGQRPQIRHPDFQYIIDPLSFDGGALNRIILFPSRVAENYRRKGFDLVIVRDWVLTSCLALDDSQTVSYLYANAKEVESNIALLQAKIVSSHRLAFSGTHDIVDHLLLCDVKKFDQNFELFKNAHETLQAIFAEGVRPSRAQLFLSYFIGILLDDMAQPRWYSSSDHALLLGMALETLKDLPMAYEDPTDLQLPLVFHHLVANLRGESVQRHNLREKKNLSQQFTSFLRESLETSAETSAVV